MLIPIALESDQSLDGLPSNSTQEGSFNPDPESGARRLRLKSLKRLGARFSRVGEHDRRGCTLAAPEQDDVWAILRASIEMKSAWDGMLFLDERPEFNCKRLEMVQGALADRPKTAAEPAVVTRTRESSIYRVLRALTTLITVTRTFGRPGSRYRGIHLNRMTHPASGGLLPGILGAIAVLSRRRTGATFCGIPARLRFSSRLGVPSPISLASSPGFSFFAAVLGNCAVVAQSCS
jgi:hypothetical protein